jgi:hypothetical protein
VFGFVILCNGLSYHTRRFIKLIVLSIPSTTFFYTIYHYLLAFLSSLGLFGVKKSKNTAGHQEVMLKDVIFSKDYIFIELLEH